MNFKKFSLAMISSRASVSQDVKRIARIIESPECKSILVLTGAGISCASGIPDFRSPGGMYDTLKPDLITATSSQRKLMEMDPSFVVEKSMFFQNAFPYLEVRRPFILGTQELKWKATIAHRFIELLHTKTAKLTRHYTQNIDGLISQCAELPSKKTVDVHGTTCEVCCENCGADVDFSDFCNEVRSKIKDIYRQDNNAPTESSPIQCKACRKATVKPKTVLFGSCLPDEFFSCCQQDLENADLLIVAGTSLVVSPANSLVYNVNENCKRVVVNTEKVGEELGIVYNGDETNRDIFAQGSCDEIFLELADALGWMDELQLAVEKLPKPSRDLLEMKIESKTKLEQGHGGK
eukprot:CAMPEP_0194239762 /NCGR_PEP_ID=MMETSP0158-20130606/6130_1 /TAXON_ID=33649 /ORGANISM="Thalassionema nitzschioides, Strain L26-B" /LENGTH=349 /DNA_ID=CAMNT_0038974313 /DNA_START=57 /DNA_END=1106 /DNA_ORIENTATION=+